MKLDMVGCAPSELLGVQRDLSEKWAGPDGHLWFERTKLMLQGKNPFEAVLQSSVWSDEIVSFSRRKLKKFFGRRVEIDPLPTSVTKELVANLAKYNIRLVFFPDIDISESFQRKGFVKLESWYYAKVKSGDIKGKAPTKLLRGWYGVDFSIGTDYTDGSQVFPNDSWSTLIERLRRDGKIGRHGETSIGSRFSITSQEWGGVLLAHMAAELQLTQAQVRLERAIEFNFIGNVYDSNRGRFNMWEWFNDPFEGSRRLYGGGRGHGGLADVGCNVGDRCWDIAAHPLVSFVK